MSLEEYIPVYLRAKLPFGRGIMIIRRGREEREVGVARVYDNVYYIGAVRPGSTIVFSYIWGDDGLQVSLRPQHAARHAEVVKTKRGRRVRLVLENLVVVAG